MDSPHYYHLRRDAAGVQWTVGATLTFGGDLNYFFIGFRDSHVPAWYGKPERWLGRIRKHLQQAMPGGKPSPPTGQLYNEGLNCLRAAEGIIHSHGMFRREVQFEAMRGSQFPTLPSRQRCIFLSLHAEVPFWWSQLSSKGARIFRVALSDSQLHHAYNGWLDDDTISHDQLAKNAHAYWSGTTPPVRPDREVLYEGSLTVLEEYQDLNDFGQRAIP